MHSPWTTMRLPEPEYALTRGETAFYWLRGIIRGGFMLGLVLGTFWLLNVATP